MRFLFFMVVILSFVSCCLVQKNKCMGFDNQYYFRLQNSTGRDLVFGPDKLYPLSQISAFSKMGSQEIAHQLFYQVMDNNDTVVSVNFSYDKYDTVFIRLGASGVNTLINKTRMSGSDCCDSDEEIIPSTFNNSAVLSANNINILVK